MKKTKAGAELNDECAPWHIYDDADFYEEIWKFYRDKPEERVTVRLKVGSSAWQADQEWKKEQSAAAKSKDDDSIDSDLD